MENKQLSEKFTAIADKLDEVVKMINEDNVNSALYNLGQLNFICHTLALYHKDKYEKCGE